MRFSERVTPGGVVLPQPLWICRCGAELTVRATAVGGAPPEPAPPRTGNFRIATLRELRHTLKEVQHHAREQRERAISLRERVQAALEKARAVQRVAAMALDDRARYLAANEPACTLTGYSETELLQLKPWALTTDLSNLRHTRDWQQFLHQGHLEGTCELVRKSGDLVVVRYTAAADIMPGVHVAAIAPRRAARR